MACWTVSHSFGIIRRRKAKSNSKKKSKFTMITLAFFLFLQRKKRRIHLLQRENTEKQVC